MNKTRSYQRSSFSTEVLEEAIKTFRQVAMADASAKFDDPTLTVDTGTETWKFDDMDEFLAEHRKPHKESTLLLWSENRAAHLFVSEDFMGTSVSVTAPTRGVIAQISSVFERKAAEAAWPSPPAPKPPPPPKPRIFIGHGGASQQWRDLKDHLTDKQGFEVIAYETGNRAGHAIRDILEQMLTASSFALLVYTGEDETADGGIRARQNVVHETGLFQGRLGFARAVVLLEDGVENFSNLAGIHYLGFAKGNIKETFGDVVATIRQEFPGS